MKQNVKSIISALLIAATLIGQAPAALAGQQNSYHDPAEHWQQAANRTNELDANAVVTRETMFCYECGKQTSFESFRTPEYSRTGKTALNRGVKYSDGTMVDGENKGNVDAGTPGEGGRYTGYHWSKAVCETCGTINANMYQTDYGHGVNVYWLYNCADDFAQKLPETVSYAYTDSKYHTKTTENGEYCGFCYGTHKETNSVLERHDLERTITPQLGHQRFAVKDACTLCDYEKTQYVAAKSVVASYFGVADGKPHTISVTDLSESGVSTKIRYGSSADSCNLTSAPNYTEKGQYTVYYEITYTFDGESMTENGAAYVWLRGAASGGDGSDCGCNNPDCGCEDKDCSGDCCADKGCGEKHSFVLLESVEPTCFELGYDRYLCTKCGKIEKRDYVDSLEHAWQSVVIREATCETEGKVLKICSRCGLVQTEHAQKGEHKYETYTVGATCVNPGYTVKECTVCGDRHITDMTAALPHKYEAVVTPATCETGGHTTHICHGCGSSFVTDHTDALGHTWDKGTIVTDKTCDGSGVTEYRCTRCGYHRLEGDAATGHVPGTEATCTAPQICTVCGVVLKLPTGHKPGDWIIDREPTTDSEGEKHKECENCGEILETETIDKLGDAEKTERHRAYIAGYPDGTVRPRGNMTRAEAVAVFARLLAEKNGDRLGAYGATRFTDIPADAWYASEVRYLSGYGIATGYADKTFRPNRTITRAEFTTMAVKFFDVYGDGNAEIMDKYDGFHDISNGDWAAEYIADAAKHGWIVGYGDGLFHGNAKITRAEVVTLVNNLLGRAADEAYITKNLRRLNTFTDLTSTRYWAYFELMEAANSHNAALGETEHWSK